MLHASLPLPLVCPDIVQQLLQQLYDRHGRAQGCSTSEIKNVLILGAVDAKIAQQWFQSAHIQHINSSEALNKLQPDFDCIIIQDVIAQSREFFKQDIENQASVLQSLQKLIGVLQNYLNSSGILMLLQQADLSSQLNHYQLIHSALEQAKLDVRHHWGMIRSQQGLNQFFDSNFFKYQAKDITAWRLFACRFDHAIVNGILPKQAKIEMAFQTLDPNAQGIAAVDAWLWICPSHPCSTSSPQEFKKITQMKLVLNASKVDGVFISQSWRIEGSETSCESIVVEYPDLALSFTIPYQSIDSISLRFLSLASQQGWTIAQLAACVQEMIDCVHQLRPDFDLISGIQRLQQAPGQSHWVNAGLQFYDPCNTGFDRQDQQVRSYIPNSWATGVPPLEPIDLRQYLLAIVLRLVSSVPCFGKQANNRHYTRLQLLENLFSYLSIYFTENELVSILGETEKWAGPSLLPYATLAPEQQQALDTIENLEQQLLKVQTQLNLQQQQAQVDLSKALELEREKVKAYVTNTYESTSSWRVTLPLRKISEAWVKLRQQIFQQHLHTVETKSQVDADESIELPRFDYRFWSEHFDRDVGRSKKGWLEQNHHTSDQAKPAIFIVLIWNPEDDLLAFETTLQSLRQQHYENWRCCLTISCSKADFIASSKEPNKTRSHALSANASDQLASLEQWANQEKRLQLLFVKDMPDLAQASFSDLANYLEQENSAAYWMGLDWGARLKPQALDMMLAQIDVKDTVVMVYADHDAYLPNGQRIQPNFKTDWNNELFYHSAMCENDLHRMGTGLFLIKRTVWSHFSRHLSAALPSGIHLQLALILSALELLNTKNSVILRQSIVHVPRVLSHHTVRHHTLEQRYPIQLLLESHFKNINRNATVLLTAQAGKITYPLQQDEKHQWPQVSMIIPTRNNHRLLKQCIESVIQKTSYTNFEIIVVDNGSDDAATLAYLRSLASQPTIRIIRDNDTFNYSSLNNHAVELAQGEFILLLNDDIEVIKHHWLEEMLAYAQQDHVGVVGAKLYYPNYTIQHAGVVLVGSIARHVHKGLASHELGYCSRAQLAQSFTAVTAACLLVRKSVYVALNGLNAEQLTIGWNDIDFCLRVQEAGYENIWTPHAQLLHHESASRGQDLSPAQQARAESEYRYMQKRWGFKMLIDPAYNPNLTDAFDDFSYAWPPRI